MKLFHLSVFTFLATLSVSAFATSINDCAPYAGHFSKQSNHDTYFAQGLEILIHPTAFTMTLKFNADLPPNQWNGWYESYFVDGQYHYGDSNVGQYAVDCEANGITIRRLGLLNTPLITKITLSGDQLTYVSFPEGHENEAQTMVLKKR